MRSASGRYLVIFLAVCGTVLAAVLALNLALGLRALGNEEVLKAASSWQEQTRGVTYAPPTAINRPFKSLRLWDRLPQIDGVVLGASTAMGITADMFPRDLSIYNFAQTGNPLAATIGEAEYLLRHDGGRLRWMVIAVDWALGHPYQPGEPQQVDLSAAAALAAGRGSEIGWTARVRDALSLPRVKALLGILRNVARAKHPWAAFRGYFVDPAGEPYRCPDGTPARDFDVVNRGICLGFRYDGSATFTDQKRVAPGDVEALILAARSPGSRYTGGLLRGGGAINPVFLDRLAAIQEQLAGRGGGLLLIFPPLLPGLEHAFLATPELAAPLRRTKAELEAWARAHGVVVIDAGRSEQFGCIPVEFIDEHHAMPSCYEKVLQRFWSERAAGSVRPGLWPSPGG